MAGCRVVQDRLLTSGHFLHFNKDDYSGCVFTKESHILRIGESGLPMKCQQLYKKNTFWTIFRLIRQKK